MNDEKLDHTRRRLLAGSVGTLAMVGVAGGGLGKKAAAAPLPASASGINFNRLIPAQGYAFHDYSLQLKPFAFQRRALLPKDVAIEILYCGVCHSDIHAAHKDWGDQILPQVPGHEMSGIVTAVGTGVTRFNVGDRVGVGTMVDSCGHCGECNAGNEQYCENQVIYSYGTQTDPKLNPGGITQGGYSNRIVVTEQFVSRIPDKMQLEHAGPIMCAGITVYSPLIHWNIRKGSTIGIVGMGGLGHLAVKMASAMGAKVIVFTTTSDKVSDARRFGATDVIINYDKEKLTQYRRKLDFILATVPYHFEMDDLVNTLKTNSTLCLVGIGRLTQPNQLSPFTTILNRNSFAGSQTGGMRQTQEVLDFCAENGIAPEVQIIPIQQTAKAWREVIDKKARYRYVIDMKSLQQS
ncbi:NAD(P)-dependent alcohol dehydrogenase [Klebsiella pneumoniae]|uniref:NAD(P)-dependent alcohol dehydrogenase n=1 Tax=Klebsiella pneumoniae TaxID=573 RepID=UPI0022ACDEF7|nr:NAD(P)-dependent alcohol dehydrogenase [Klebsiella pneumoniae]WRP72445.1 NAD(P)-dependent alcohol dehydrogenase [Klebsiella pneumoniae]HCT5903108.1 NAD(P)-dependent alcohol dehydrogenase [Klebsiella pneumoniae]